MQAQRLLRLPPPQAEAGADGAQDDPGPDEPGLDGRWAARGAAEQRQREHERDAAAAGEAVHVAGAPRAGADLIVRTRHKFVKFYQCVWGHGKFKCMKKRSPVLFCAA